MLNDEFIFKYNGPRFFCNVPEGYYSVPKVITSVTLTLQIQGVGLDTLLILLQSLKGGIEIRCSYLVCIYIAYD